LLWLQILIYHGHATHCGREVEGSRAVWLGVALVLVGVGFGRRLQWWGWLVGTVGFVVGNAKSRSHSADQVRSGASPGPGTGTDR
jgi:hypothetical protein